MKNTKLPGFTVADASLSMTFLVPDAAEHQKWAKALEDAKKFVAAQLKVREATRALRLACLFACVVGWLPLPEAPAVATSNDWKSESCV